MTDNDLDKLAETVRTAFHGTGNFPREVPADRAGAGGGRVQDAAEAQGGEVIYVGVDPGGTVGVAIYEPERRRVLLAGEYADPVAAMDAISWARLRFGDFRLACEGLTLYRQPADRGPSVVGEPVFNAARQAGWFSAHFDLPPSGPHILTNPQVRNLLLGHLAANQRGEAMINRYLKDQHGGDDSTRGALAPVEPTFRKDGSIWRKPVPGRAQGALYGVVGHAWSALACAVAAAKRDGFWSPR